MACKTVQSVAGLALGVEHRAGGVETVVPDRILDGGDGVEFNLDPPGDLLRAALPAQGTRNLGPFQLAEQDRLEEGAERAGVDGAGLHDLAEEPERGIDDDAETPPSLPREAGHIGPQGEAYLPTGDFFSKNFPGPCHPRPQPHMTAESGATSRRIRGGRDGPQATSPALPREGRRSVDGTVGNTPDGFTPST